MFISTTLALLSTTPLILARPTPLLPRAVPSFPAGSSWDIVLNSGSIGNIKKVVTPKTFATIDIDLFDTSPADIAALSTGKKVICYFSAGSYEDWRADKDAFVDGDMGKELDGWPGERWLNVKSSNVKNIMKKRIAKAKAAGCTAVDPDNVDGFSEGQDGFGYDQSVYVEYVKFLAQEAKAQGLAIGLKNSVSMIPKMVDVVDFAVNEQCHDYAECGAYKPFTQKNKAVFNIEYGNGGDACISPAGVKLSTLVKSEDQSLDTLGGACPGQVDEPAKSSAKPTSTAKGVVSTPSPTPTKVNSVKPSSTKKAPTSTNVASVAPKPSSTKLSSTKPSVSKPTPTKASPTKASPTKATPTKATPTKAPPANATPTKAIPSNATPVKPSSTKPCATSTKSSRPTGVRHPHWSKPWWTKSN